MSEHVLLGTLGQMYSSWSVKYQNVFFYTSRVSQPPTMLRPRPVRPLEMLMVVSHPGMMGQVAGSQTMVEGVDERLWPWNKEDWDVTLRCQRNKHNAKTKTHWWRPLSLPLPLQGSGCWRLERQLGKSKWCPKTRHPGRLTEDGRNRKQSFGWTSLLSRQKLFIEFFSSYLLRGGTLCWFTVFRWRCVFSFHSAFLHRQQGWKNEKKKDFQNV